jgi:hypothetical protein
MPRIVQRRIREELVQTRPDRLVAGEVGEAEGCDGNRKKWRFGEMIEAIESGIRR